MELSNFFPEVLPQEAVLFGRPTSNRCHPRNLGGGGFISPPQELVDKFFMRNGLPISDPNSGYTETGFTSEPIFYENTSYDLTDPERTKGMVVGKDVFTMYANREPRIPPYGNDKGMIPPPAGQDKIRELIRTERRVELCFEGEIHYNDIRRWKIAEKIFSEPIMGMNVYGATQEEFYVRTIVTQPKFDKKMYLWPIKQTFIDNNPNLIQNKFW
jgi:hypothetical protein